MNLSASTNLLEIIACPDCKADINEIKIDGQLLGFYCEKCKLVFPVTEDIPILLSSGTRRYELEYDLIQNIIQRLRGSSMGLLTGFAQNSLKLVNERRGKNTWAWEDETHWNKVYLAEADAETGKNWNDRIWQREFLVKALFEKTSVNARTIMDAGCGEGQNFRMLMSGHFDESNLYIGADISLAGLKLNRLRNPHKNSIYILCSADSLPVQKNKIDILCYFGVLHHTEKKSAGIAANIDTLKKGAYILLHEPVARPSPSYLTGMFFTHSEESAHEENLDGKVLAETIKQNNLVEVASSYRNTVFFTLIMRLFTGLMTNHKTFFVFVSGIDSILMKLFGKIIPYFKAGTVMMVLSNSGTSKSKSV